MHVKGGFYFNYLSNPPIMGTGTIQYIFTIYTRSPPQYLGCHSNTFCSFSSSFSLHFSPASSLHHLVNYMFYMNPNPSPPTLFSFFPFIFHFFFRFVIIFIICLVFHFQVILFTSIFISFKIS